MRGFTQPLAVVVGLLVCVVIGYALMSGLSEVRTQTAAGARGTVIAGVGKSLDEPLPGETRSEEPPAQDALVPAAKEPEAEAPGDDLEDYLSVSFAKLSNYLYEYPDPSDPNPPRNQIPEDILKLDGRKVAVRGFMLPVKQEKGKLVEFLLMKDQSACCFGVMPQMNEWIHVRCRKGESAKMVWDIPVTVFGTLEVGELYEGKTLISIYRMVFDKLVEPVR